MAASSQGASGGESQPAEAPSERHVTLNVLDLLRFARRYEPNTSAIVITSFDDDAHGYRVEPGVVAVLHKPVELSQLRLELADHTH